MYRKSPGSPADQSNSQRLVWSAISVSELRLSSAMWYRAGSAWGESCDWLVWAILSRECTMAWRRQVIHCCLLKESLACRQYGWSLERPLLLTRKQFLTARRREKEGKEGVSFTSANELELHDSLSVWAWRYSNTFIPHFTKQQGRGGIKYARHERNNKECILDFTVIVSCSDNSVIVKAIYRMIETLIDWYGCSGLVTDTDH